MSQNEKLLLSLQEGYTDNDIWKVVLEFILPHIESLNNDSGTEINITIDLNKWDPDEPDNCTLLTYPIFDTVMNNLGFKIERHELSEVCGKCYCDSFDMMECLNGNDDLYLILDLKKL